MGMNSFHKNATSAKRAWSARTLPQALIIFAAGVYARKHGIVRMVMLPLQSMLVCCLYMAESTGAYKIAQLLTRLYSGGH